jgi:hypothetical protein
MWTIMAETEPGDEITVLDSLTLIHGMDADGAECVIIRGADGMTLMQALGLLEFAKVWVIETYQNTHGSG